MSYRKSDDYDGEEILVDYLKRECRVWICPHCNCEVETVANEDGDFEPIAICGFCREEVSWRKEVKKIF